LEDGAGFAKCLEFMDMNLLRDRFLKAVDICKSVVGNGMACLGRHLEFSDSEVACYEDLMKKSGRVMPSFF
ncbi:hypothetical protein HPB47_009309, partial [Ixodes persulcatus]